MSGCPADAYLFFMDLFSIYSSKKTHRYELSFLRYVTPPSRMSGCPADAYLFLWTYFSHIHRRKRIAIDYLFCGMSHLRLVCPAVRLMRICFFMDIFSAYPSKKTHRYKIPFLRYDTSPSSMSGCPAVRLMRIFFYGHIFWIFIKENVSLQNTFFTV
jgi:hypothetical protein